MTIYLNLVRRNLKLFFKDKGMFISALITPMILLVLYATFLSKVYRDSFESALLESGALAMVPPSLLNGTVVSQLISSLLAVSCVTVSFCSNLLMINDKANNVLQDFTVSPVKRSFLAAGYFSASALSTLIVSFSALTVCLLYLLTQGWYLTFADVLFVIADVLLVTLFGTTLSSCINAFLSTTGQASAVGTIVSAGYGFLCGAYMPISNFPKGLQHVLSLLPGTYGTSLLRNHMLNGCFDEMARLGFPEAVLDGIRRSIDCKLEFFGHDVSIEMMYLILAGAVLLLLILFILLQMTAKRKK